jgi:hypothetical protein
MKSFLATMALGAYEVGATYMLADDANCNQTDASVTSLPGCEASNDC